MGQRQAGERSIVLDGRRVSYRVRRSERAKSLQLRVVPGLGLEVVAPQRGKLPDLAPILRERSGWILRALDRVAAREAAARAAPRPGDPILYRGEEYRLVVGAGRRLDARLDEAARTLTLILPAAGNVELSAALEGWYWMRARAVLEERAAHFAAALGVDYGRVTIRDQRTRWGSCSSLGNLNFNWRLILAPPAVLDYVVVHELAHRREANHSPRFWALVAAHCPDYQAHRAWLKNHGTMLMQHGGDEG